MAREINVLVILSMYRVQHYVASVVEQVACTVLILIVVPGISYNT